MTDKSNSLIQRLQRAVQLHQRGFYLQAESFTRQILNDDLNHSDSNPLLKLLSRQLERFSLANPDYAEITNHFGEAFHTIGEVDEAISCYKLALEKKPDYCQAYINLGNAAQAFRQYGQSVLYYKKAISLQNDYLEAHHNLGNVLRCLGYPEKAIPCYLESVTINPSHVDGWLELGHVYFDLGQISEAEECYREAVKINPGSAQSYHALGIILREFGDLDQAIETLQKAITIKPDYATAYINVAAAYRLQGQFAAARQAYQQALQIDPKNPAALASLSFLLQEICAWPELAELKPRLDRKIKQALNGGDLSPETVFTNITRHVDPQFNLLVARSWGHFISKKIHRTDPFQHHVAPGCWSNHQEESGKIRIGYLANDFTSYTFLHGIGELFKHHERSSFEVYGYSFGGNDNHGIKVKIAEYLDHFLDIREMSFTQAAERINADKINILIDLTGHAKDNRMEICALRPAPIQVSYLGFPGTSGSYFMDFIIADKVTIPEEHISFYSEKVVYLPSSYYLCCNGRKTFSQTINRSEYRLPESGVVFCSFNRTCLIDVALFKVWMAILDKVPDSILWLMEADPLAENNLREAAKAAGISPERLVFSKKELKPHYHAQLQLADLVLDTHTYNGQTSSSAALWAGIPVITLEGGHFASRVGSSILQALQLPELITRSLEEYKSLAVHLATNPETLTAIRNKIERNRRSTPLFDTKRRTQELEAAYIQMWQGYLQKRSTQSKVY
jgi:protein O-GlcNAc transferase